MEDGKDPIKDIVEEESIGKAAKRHQSLPIFLSSLSSWEVDSRIWAQLPQVLDQINVLF